MFKKQQKNTSVETKRKTITSPKELVKPITTFSDVVKTYWGYFMTFVAIVTFIWTLGVKSERKSVENTSFKEDIASIKVVQKEQTQKIDCLLVIIEDVKTGQTNLIESQNALRSSYVKYLSNDKGLTKKDFLTYMEGIQFQIKQIQIKKDSIK